MAYFDNNSTTPPYAEVIDAIKNAHENDWANPSSPHRAGAQVRAFLENAREEFAHSFGVDPARLIFTSGATEANNSIIGWVANQQFCSGKIAMVSSIEHPSVIEPATHVFSNRLVEVPVNKDGLVEVDHAAELIKAKSPGFVSILAAHNETGVLQPWMKIAQLCKDLGIWFHCDVTQWCGKLSLAGFDQCSSFSFSAHKFGGPKGVGGCFSKEPIRWLHGGSQEMESRGGTENFPSIEGMRIAWKQTEGKISSQRLMEEGRNKFEKNIKDLLPEARIIGENAPRLWNTSFLLLPQFENLSWLSKLDRMGHSLSTGSACSTGRVESSGLAKAIGLSPTQARRLVRVSSWFDTKKSDWDELVESLVKAFNELREDQKRSGLISLP